MDKKTEDLTSSLKSDTSNFLKYMKARIPVFHNSNIFYRDLENGIISFYEKKGTQLKYSQAGAVTQKYLEHLEAEKVLIRTGREAWKVNYPEFVTERPGDPF